VTVRGCECVLGAKNAVALLGLLGVSTYVDIPRCQAGMVVPSLRIQVLLVVF